MPLDKAKIDNLEYCQSKYHAHLIFNEVEGSSSAT